MIEILVSRRNHFDVLEIEFAQVTIKIALTLQTCIDAMYLHIKENTIISFFK